LRNPLEQPKSDPRRYRRRRRKRPASNGSGDFVIAFTASPEPRILAAHSEEARQTTVLGNDAMSPLFEAAIEATEEAIINSLFKATTVTGQGHTVEALPLEKTRQILQKHRVSD
jgi:D-aminopeptidase